MFTLCSRFARKIVAGRVCAACYRQGMRFLAFLALLLAAPALACSPVEPLDSWPRICPVSTLLGQSPGLRLSHWTADCPARRRATPVTWPRLGISTIPAPDGQRNVGPRATNRLVRVLSIGREHLAWAARQPDRHGDLAAFAWPPGQSARPEPDPCRVWPHTGAALGSGLRRALLIAPVLQLHYL